MVSLLPKMERFCSFQPRSVFEVRTKFRGEAESDSQLDQWIVALHEQGFLDDRKFAHDYTRGKVRSHRWGPRLVVYRLSEKRVDQKWITEALLEHETEFREALQYHIQKKMRNSRQVMSPAQRAGLRRYLGQKGFDWEEIDRALQHP
ncbi:hypothetical protein GC167_08640 [bacterium]|nr:hypothetical protein [bacterium]